VRVDLELAEGVCYPEARLVCGAWLSFGRKFSPRLAILRALIRRDLRSDWLNSLDFGVVIRLEPRCQATQALP
jgi:hypothetical protein